ncbi:MAG TPA: LPS assembly lipoprotein LptE [Stellaceae bacterium]|nr:LPS assembly lipoprotein LptE [Stellaceae bacterium]
MSSSDGRGARRALALFPLAALAACGFHPLYSTSEPLGYDPVLASVDVRPAPDRVGQILVERLREQLNPAGAQLKPRYVLNLTLSLLPANLGLQRDNTSTHGELTLIATMKLSREGSQAVVYEQTVQRVASFDFPFDAYAANVAQDNARDIAANDLAREIAEKLQIYLQQHPPPEPT